MSNKNMEKLEKLREEIRKQQLINDISAEREMEQRALVMASQEILNQNRMMNRSILWATKELSKTENQNVEELKKKYLKQLKEERQKKNKIEEDRLIREEMERQVNKEVHQDTIAAYREKQQRQKKVDEYMQEIKEKSTAKRAKTVEKPQKEEVKEEKMTIEQFLKERKRLKQSVDEKKKKQNPLERIEQTTKNLAKNIKSTGHQLLKGISTYMSNMAFYQANKSKSLPPVETKETEEKEFDEIIYDKEKMKEEKDIEYTTQNRAKKCDPRLLFYNIDHEKAKRDAEKKKEEKSNTKERYEPRLGG